MEDLWRTAGLSYRTDDLADRVEYEELIKRFCVEEERNNRERLLYGDAQLSRDSLPER